MLSARQRRAIRLASRFVAPYRWQALGALLALIVTAGITLSMGQGIRLLVDQGFMTQSPHLLNQSIGLFMILVLGLAVGTFTRFYLVSWIGERVVADIRRQVFNHLIYLHPGFYENNRSSEIQSRLTTDTTLLQSVIGSSLSLFLRNALMVIGGIVLLFVTNPKLTSIVVIALPLVLAPIRSLVGTVDEQRKAFDQLRKLYPPRREIEGLKVRISGDSAALSNIVAALGAQAI